MAIDATDTIHPKCQCGHTRDMHHRYPDGDPDKCRMLVPEHFDDRSLQKTKMCVCNAFKAAAKVAV